MSDTLAPINPLQYIAEHMPTDESAKNVANWFKNERMELNFGDYIGRPSENFQMRSETLGPLLQQGWYITAVKQSAEEGEWQHVTTGTSASSSTSSGSATQSATSQSSSTASSSGESASDATATNNSSSHTTTNQNLSSGSSTTTGSGSGTNSSTGSNANTGTESATGTNSSSGTETAEGSETGTTTETGTDPYWCAYALIRLERRRMQADAVLQTMVDSFVANYNWGRKVNVERYDEIVALYALMLSRTEDEANALVDANIDFDPLFDKVTKAIEAALSKYTDVADSLPADWLQSRKDEINRKFDALVSEAKAKMIDAGTYNGTIWPGVEAGIERQREDALTALGDESVKMRLEAYKDAASITASVHEQLVAAQVRIFEALQKQKLEPTNLRNTVFKWMLDFMEKREDAYPGISELPTIAQRLGYEGGIAAPASIAS